MKRKEYKDAIFTHIYSLVDVRQCYVNYIEKGCKHDVAFYPLGIPLEDKPVLHLELAAQVRAGVAKESWKEVQTIKHHAEFLQMTLLNVLQALLYKSYVASFEKRREYLFYLEFIWKNHCGPIFKHEKAQ